MSKTIAVTSGKGGVGKSSVVVNMGIILAQMGNKVCLIDMDLGLKNLDIMMGLQHRSIFDLKDVMEGRCILAQAMIRDKKEENLYLIPACKSLRINEFPNGNLLRIIEELKQHFDYIILDTPAGIENGFCETIKCAQQAVIVTTLDVTALQDADRVIGLLMKEGISDLAFVINRYQPHLIDKGSMVGIDDAKTWLAIDFLGYILEDEQMIRANNHGIPLCQNKHSYNYDYFVVVVKRMLKEYVPLLKVKGPSLLAKLFQK